MIHCCILVQSGDWRKYAERISCQEDNNLRNSSLSRNLSIVNVGDRVAHTGILRDRVIIIIRLSCFRIQNYVLHLASETDGIVNLRLILRIQIDALCIAAALEVEYAVVRPAVLVVTDELSSRIGGESCLSCSGETEEYSCLMGLRIHVGRAVHREYILLNRHQIVHYGEYGFLDLSGILGTGNQYHLVLEVDNDSCLGICPVYSRIAGKARSCNDGKIRCAVIFQLLSCRSDQ